MRSVRTVIFAICASIISFPASAYAWEIIVGTGQNEENLIKLLHSAGDYSDADIYFRCEAGSGWIFLIHNTIANEGHSPLRLKFGSQVLNPSYRLEYNEVDDLFYFDAAIPASFSGFKELSNGGVLEIEGSKYSAKAGRERGAIETFVQICGSE